MIARRALLAHAATLVACGYAPVRAVTSGAMSVRAGVSTAAEPRLLGDVVDAARRALRREGAFDPGASTALVVDVLRLEERTTAIESRGTGLRARGTTLGLVGRGRTEPGGYDTGELFVATESGDEADPLADATRRADVASLLAKKLGDSIVMTILGLPTTETNRL